MFKCLYRIIQGEQLCFPQWYWKVWYFTWKGAKEEFNTGNRFNPSALGNRGNTNADESLFINGLASFVHHNFVSSCLLFFLSSSHHLFLCLYCSLHLSYSIPGWYISANLVLFTVIWIDVPFCVQYTHASLSVLFSSVSDDFQSRFCFCFVFWLLLFWYVFFCW